jgi:hypothetical protein
MKKQKMKKGQREEDFLNILYHQTMRERAMKGKYFVFVADVHGRIDKLDAALASCHSWLSHAGIKREDTQFVFGGDYIDRYPNHREVIMRVKEYVTTYGDIALIGNHDMFLLGTGDMSDTQFEDGSLAHNYRLWAINGGDKTCFELYGAPPTKYDDGSDTPLCMENKDIHVDDRMVRCYRDLILKSEEYKFLKEHGKMFYESRDIYFCHAPQSDVKNITDSSLIWGRRSDYTKTDEIFKVPGGKTMSVHGHYHRLNDRINFPRLNYYKHGGVDKTVILADSGCGCSSQGELHPVIIKEFINDPYRNPQIMAIL